MNKMILSIALVFAAGAAKANVTEIRLPDDASGLAVVSTKLGKVQTGENCKQVDGPDEEGYPQTCDAVFSAGLLVDVSYHAKGAFRDWENEGADNGPFFIDFGTEEFGVAGATALLSAKLVVKQVQEQVVDEATSKFCPRDNEGSPDVSCTENIQYKNVLATHTFLTLETK